MKHNVAAAIRADDNAISTVGTTIFCVVGSILIVAAGVLLITKKRMSREG